MCLPWVEYLPDSRCFLLEDGVSVGALFELTPAGTEARTPVFMSELRDAIQTAVTEAIPERDDAPWILQCFVQDEPSLSALMDDVAAYPPAAVRASAYAQHYVNGLKEHAARSLPSRRAVRGHGLDRHAVARPGAARARHPLPPLEPAWARTESCRR